MTETVTVLAPKRNRLHSHRLHMERVRINREDELFILGAESRFSMRRVLAKSGRHGF